MGDTLSLEVARLIVAELEYSAGANQFGVIVQDVHPLCMEDLVVALAASRHVREGRLRVALVDATGEAEQALAKQPGLAEVLSHHEERAVQWRNKPLKTIGVVTNELLSKGASLRDFRLVDEQVLIRRHCEVQHVRWEADTLRALWRVLMADRALRLSLQAVVRFALELEGHGKARASSEAPASLALLGLFADSHLVDDSSEQELQKRLRLNRNLVDEIRRATSEDWARARTYARSLNGREKTAATQLISRLRVLADEGTSEEVATATLRELDFQPVLALWHGRPARGKGIRDKATRVPIEERIGCLLLDPELPLKERLNALADVAEELKQIADNVSEDQETRAEVDVNKASNSETKATLRVDHDLLDLVAKLSSPTSWGARIEVGSDRPTALVEHPAFKATHPFHLDSVLSIVRKFTESDLAPKSLLEGLESLVAKRDKLLPHVAELALSPIGALAGRPALLKAAADFIDGYEQCLQAITAAHGELQEASEGHAEDLLSHFLSLELYLYQRDQALEVVLSPLHPLQLWRSVAVVRDILGLKKALSPHEAAAVQEAMAEDIQLLPVLVVPGRIVGRDKPILFGQAGNLGRLPMFRAAPRGMLEPDGVATVAELAERLAILRPFARRGLQVVLVDLPQPARFVEALLDRLGDNELSSSSFTGLHVRIRYTQEATRVFASGIADLSEVHRELLARGQEAGTVSLSVGGSRLGWDELTHELDRLPAHLLVVVDPFEVKAQTVQRLARQAIGPWMVSCAYRYNRLDREIQAIPMADDYVFGAYRGAAALLDTSLQKKTAAHLPQVRDMRAVLGELSARALWTVVADPHRVPIARLGEAEVLDRRVERGRQLTCFGRDLTPFCRRLDDQLRRTHFEASRETQLELVRELAALEPDGILRLGHSSSDKQVKGSLGKIIASRWYRAQEPGGLAVSLDTEGARRWLAAGDHGGVKADLLGLREEDGVIVIDVIEVKAHDEAAPYTVKDGIIQGGPVGQVQATLQALAEVFGPPETSPLAAPRREVVRDHLYSALIREVDRGAVERWFEILEGLFEGKRPVKLGGRIIHVQLASVASKAHAVYQTDRGVFIRVDTLSAADVGLMLTPLVSARKLPAEPPLPAGKAAKGAGLLDPAEAFKALTEPVVVPVDSESETTVDEVGPEGVSKPPRTVVEGPPPEVLDVLLGQERGGSGEVRWAPGKQSNGFFLILGASGSGKTETLKRIGAELDAQGIPVLVFDFHGDVTFPRLHSVLLSSGTASKVGLNPMEIDVHSAEESGLYDQRGALVQLITRAVPALGHRQKSLLRDAIEATYQGAGIRDDDAATWKRAAPTFAEVVATLNGWIDDDEHKSSKTGIEGCLAAIEVLFGHPIFQRDQHVSIDDMRAQSTRLDLSKLPDNVRFIATETLLRRIFRKLRLEGPIPVQATDRERFRLFVIIDEAKILSLGGGERDRADGILNELMTEARKFGLGMIIASQMSDHFSEDVRANAATWLVLKPMELKEARKNAANVSVDGEDLMRLAGRGDGYYRDKATGRGRRIQVLPVSPPKP